MNSGEKITAESGALVRQEFGALQALQASGALAAEAAAAQAKAMVEARYVMALQRPRKWDQVRQDILAECRRPAFARNKSAFYIKPIGEGVEGLGIRFVEVALRCMTNILVESVMVFEDEDKEIFRVTVTDLETNNTWPADVRVLKTVERSRPVDDGSYLSVRLNAKGKPVYTVPATDEDMLNKRQAQISKTIRTLGLRHIPGGIQDEAEAIIREIRQNDAAQDPDGERKRIVDAFGTIGVKASDLIDYLGHDLGTCSPNELVMLRGIYGSIRDGQMSWAAVVDEKRSKEGDDEPRAGRTMDELRKRAKDTGQGPGTSQTAPEPAQDPGQQSTSQTPAASQGPAEPAQGGKSDDSGRWPEQFTDPETGEVGWRDCDRAFFDPDKHGWNRELNQPSTTPRGAFRKKREPSGGGQPQKAPQEQSTAPQGGPDKFGEME